MKRNVSIFLCLAFLVILTAACSGAGRNYTPPQRNHIDSIPTRIQAALENDFIWQSLPLHNRIITRRLAGLLPEQIHDYQNVNFELCPHLKHVESLAQRALDHPHILNRIAKDDLPTSYVLRSGKSRDTWKQDIRDELVRMRDSSAFFYRKLQCGSLVFTLDDTLLRRLGLNRANTRAYYSGTLTFKRLMYTQPLVLLRTLEIRQVK